MTIFNKKEPKKNGAGTRVIEIGLIFFILILSASVIIPKFIPAESIIIQTKIPQFNPSNMSEDWRYLAVIQAGHCTHDGNFSCAKKNTYRNKGTGGFGVKESELTLIIANVARKKLIEAGFPFNKVAVIGAHTGRFSRVISTGRIKHFVSLHFDGNDRRCATGASVGYPRNGSRKYDNIKESKAHAQRWKEYYYKFYPDKFKKKRDNLTPEAAGHYMYHRTNSQTDMLIEFAELTCRKTSKWATQNIDKLGEILAIFLANEINGTHTNEPDKPKSDGSFNDIFDLYG